VLAGGVFVLQLLAWHAELLMALSCKLLLHGACAVGVLAQHRVLEFLPNSSKPWPLPQLCNRKIYREEEKFNVINQPAQGLKFAALQDSKTVEQQPATKGTC
jgi:hypothetical protein